MLMRSRMVYFHGKRFVEMHFCTKGKHAVRGESLYWEVRLLSAIPGSTPCCWVTLGTVLKLHLPQIA